MRNARLQKLQRLRREWPFFVFLFYALVKYPYNILNLVHPYLKGIWTNFRAKNAQFSKKKPQLSEEKKAWANTKILLNHISYTSTV